MKYSKGIGFVAIIIIIAVLGVLGGGIYMVTQNKASLKTEEKTTSEDATASEPVAEINSNTSLRALIALGKNLVCTFKETDADTSTSGTMYIASAGNQFRGDFTVKTNADGTINGHMIKQGDYIYSWSDAATQGSKMKAEAESDTEESDTVGLDDEAEYDCKSWNVDNSKFKLPSNIEFVDISAFMQTGAGASGSINANQCGACDAAPDADSKAQCRAALGC